MRKFSKEETARGDYRELNPERWDFFWNADFSEVTAIPLTWWDDASYAAYQGDPYPD